MLSEKFATVKYVFFNVLSVTNSNQLRTLPDELQNNFFRSSLTKHHEIFAETRINEEGPSLAVIRPLKIWYFEAKHVSLNKIQHICD
jgi:hypothetical protein